MKVVLQRVSEAKVVVEGKTVGEISRGLLLLIGMEQGDEEPVISKMAEKIVHLRIFPDEKGRFDKSCLDINGEILTVSQFTLLADCNKGRRPDFFKAMEPELASSYCEKFVSKLEALGVAKVATGEFGAEMQVSLTNDGPVTILLEF